MQSIKVHSPSSTRHLDSDSNPLPASPLPSLLQTPAGLALIEIQGTINHPQSAESGDRTIQIGRIEFPDYRANDPLLADDGQGRWQKRVWLYVGDHQRLTGEVKKLPKPFGVLRKKQRGSNNTEEMQGVEGVAAEELEIAEIIKWKIVFSSRPEPVGVATEL